MIGGRNIKISGKKIIKDMWHKKEIHLEQILSFLIKAFLFILPWQTIWIYREQFLNGFKWQYGKPPT